MWCRCVGRDLIASGCSSGAMYIWNVQSGQRLHTMEPAHDSVWALRSLAWASGGGARTCFMLAAASRDKLGRVFSGVFTTDSTVITESHSSRPSGLLVHVLRGHSMALLCMDLTWLQAGEAFGVPAACPLQGPLEHDTSRTGIAVVALGSAGAVYCHMSWTAPVIAWDVHVIRCDRRCGEREHAHSTGPHDCVVQMAQHLCGIRYLAGAWPCCRDSTRLEC